MCGKSKQQAAQTFDANGQEILPACANSAKCGGACKRAKEMAELAESGITMDVRPIMIGQIHVPQLIFNQV